MKKSKEQKAQEKLAAMLGIEAPTAVSKAESHARSMEAEAALEYYDNPRTFSHKECKLCNRSFATRGAPVAYCSDSCRVKAFEQRMGIKWQPLRPTTERWGFMGEPLVVPHEALVVVQAVMEEQQERYSMIVESDYDEQPEIAPVESVDVLDLLDELGLS